MDDVKIKLKENLKKANLEVNEKEEQMILLLLKHKYGLYAAEMARMAKFEDSRVRVALYNLKKKGLLESKEVESLVSQSIAHGHKLSIPEGYKVISSNGIELPFEKECMTKISVTDIVSDKEGFRIPFQRGPGRQKSVIFKIKKETFEILSQK